MKKLSRMKWICALGLATLCIGVLVACSDSDSSSGASSESSSTSTGGVAATVNGTEIKEDDITATLESGRNMYVYYYAQLFGDDIDTDDEGAMWAAYFEYLDETPEEAREEAIDSEIDRELVLQYADERGVNIDKATIDPYVDEMRDNYANEDAWQTALESLGITEAEYRDEIKYDLTYQDVYASFGEEADEEVDEEADEDESADENADRDENDTESVDKDDTDATEEDEEAEEAEEDEEADEAVELTDEELLAYAQENAKDLYDGAKRSSHILFDVEDEETAEEILEKIKSGELDFAEAAKEYSTDTGSAEEGGDVGWDALVQFVDEYQDALDELNKDEISDLVESEYGYHIIKCTDVFNVPDEITSLSDWPEDIVEDMREQATDEKEEELEEAQEEAYNEWLEECRDKADITINEMPADVPYNIDLSAYEEADEEVDEEADEQTVEETAEEEAEISDEDVNTANDETDTDKETTSTDDEEENESTASSENATEGSSSSSDSTTSSTTTN